MQGCEDTDIPTNRQRTGTNAPLLQNDDEEATPTVATGSHSQPRFHLVDAIGQSQELTEVLVPKHGNLERSASQRSATGSILKSKRRVEDEGAFLKERKPRVTIDTTRIGEKLHSALMDGTNEAQTVVDVSPPASKLVDIDNWKEADSDEDNHLPTRLSSKLGSSHMSYVSLRKAANEIVQRAKSDAETIGHIKSSRGSSLSSLGGKVHPIIQWLNRTKDTIMKSPMFKTVVGFLAADRTKILFYFSVMCIAHGIVTAVFIMSLWLIVPGIWVYNFMQMFVIICALIGHAASSKLSEIVRTSITAGDMLRGRITLPQLADYWVRGPKSPAQNIIQTSAYVEVISGLILVCSSIVFSWEAIQTKLQSGQCIPPIYTGSYLPVGIDIQQFLQGDVDFADDGLVGGWPGWPMNNPMDSFQIIGSGPSYVIQVLCDNGVPTPDLDYGISAVVEATFCLKTITVLCYILFLCFLLVAYMTLRRISTPNTSFLQSCTRMTRVGYSSMTYHFVADQWAMVTNGQLVTINSPRNEFPDGYYYTNFTYRGVAVGIGAAAHFAMMQYVANATPVTCDYYGFDGSGMLVIPNIAIYLSAAGSALACIIKCFEILWWYMAQNGIEYESYRRARRVLRHPMRFALDAAEMLATGMASGDHDDDICDATTTRAIEELGNARIVYGEDILTREMEVGHLRIGEYGKIKSIHKDKRYGTFRPSLNPEWDEFIRQ
ncbi:hypothetical protein BC830DRAFT_1135299 [Chytriomyces sp. MP71]|nr:hypothetical protein BC830DRAFT_1135299 [Chytriomyces sp. MP71]